MPTLKIAAVALMMLGVLLLFGAVVVIVRRVAFAQRATAVKGTVIRCERNSGVDGGWLYTPTVRYQGPDGRELEHTPSISTNMSNYAVGESVTVLIDPLQPGAVMIGRPGSSRVWMVPAVFGFTGGVIGGIGALLYLLAGGLQ